MSKIEVININPVDIGPSDPPVVVSAPDDIAIITVPEQGPPGPPGQGLPGPQGPQGAVGAVGPQGVPGVQGPKGDTGPVSTVPGPMGPQGVKGDKGDKGDTGNTGLTGPQGAKGDKGDTGATGAASTVPGPAGPQGAQGNTGSTGPVPWQNPPTPWVTAHAYVLGPPASLVTDSGNCYVATVSHTSGATFAADLAAGKWAPVVSGGGGGSSVYTGDTPPVGAPVNSLWWESDSGLLFLNYNDGNSTQWVLVSAQTSAAAITDAVKFTPQTLTTAQKTQAKANIGVGNRGKIDGLTLSTAGTSVVMTVAPGEAADSTNVDLLVLTGALSKTLASVWSVGNNGGILDTGLTTANTFYHLFLIKRLDTGLVDVLASFSATAPTLPSPYTLFRRIGAMYTGSSLNWAGFTQLGDEFLLAASVSNVNTTQGAGSNLYALSVPTGIQVNALGRITMVNATAGVNLLVQSPDQNAEAPNNVPGNSTLTVVNANVHRMALNVRTNTAGQIRAQGSAAGSTFQWVTYGWIDTRGRNS